MIDLPDTSSTALTAEMMQRQRAVDTGCTWGHIHPEQIAGLCNQAAKHGKRQPVLEITADAPTDEKWTGGRVQVKVKGAPTWDDEQQQQDARAKAVT